MCNRPFNPTANTATSGESATANAYGAGLVMPIMANSTQTTIRTTPSLPMITAYEWKRPLPEQIPRAMWAGAYATKAVIRAARPSRSVAIGWGCRRRASLASRLDREQSRQCRCRPSGLRLRL